MKITNKLTLEQYDLFYSGNLKEKTPSHDHFTNQKEGADRHPLYLNK